MHDTSHHSPDSERLFQQAAEQHGHFTAMQAKQYGYSGSLLSHHARPGGRFIRVRRGLYRLRNYPPSRWEDVMAAWLSAGREHAVVSHETALELLDLTDIIPDAIHLTVPRERRWYRAPEGVVIHTSERPLPPHEVVVREGMRVTGPVRTIMDMAEAGLAPEHVAEAVRQSRDRGLATSRQLREAAAGRGGYVEELVGGILDELGASAS